VQYTRTITLPCILHVLSYLPITIFFIRVAYPGHILESTKGIEIKLGTYIDVNERKYRRQETNIIIHFTWIISPYFFHKRLFSWHVWCTSGVWLQVLPLIDNSHLRSILRFQRFSFYNCFHLCNYMCITLNL